MIMFYKLGLKKSFQKNYFVLLAGEMIGPLSMLLLSEKGVMSFLLKINLKSLKSWTSKLISKPLNSSKKKCKSKKL